MRGLLTSPRSWQAGTIETSPRAILLAGRPAGSPRKIKSDAGLAQSPDRTGCRATRGSGFCRLGRDVGTTGYAARQRHVPGGIHAAGRGHTMAHAAPIPDRGATALAPANRYHQSLTAWPDPATQNPGLVTLYMHRELALSHYTVPTPWPRVTSGDGQRRAVWEHPHSPGLH